MSIDIAIWKMTDATGRVLDVDVKATITYSPREGFDAGKLEGLELDLGKFVKARLTDALGKGCAA